MATRELFFVDGDLETVARNLHTELHQLSFYGKWSIVEAYNLPIGLRKHYLNMLKEAIKEQSQDKNIHQI